MKVRLESMTPEEYGAYRSDCDSRSAAEFRLRRELCGIEYTDLVDALDVRLDTVKRWENPNKGMPPSVRAWAYVDSAYLSLMESVEAAIEAVESAEDAGTLDVAEVAYRRGFHRTRGGESVARANAVSRAVYVALKALGYDVRAEWSDRGAVRVASESR